MYDARMIHDAKIKQISEHLEDLVWFYDTGAEFRYVRNYYFNMPIEAIMRKGPPHTWMDLEHIYETAEQMRAWSRDLLYLSQQAENVAEKIEELGIKYLKPGI
jgi:hypothetical protein